jgi:hypothetical protein
VPDAHASPTPPQRILTISQFKQYFVPQALAHTFPSLFVVPPITKQNFQKEHIILTSHKKEFSIGD